MSWHAMREIGSAPSRFRSRGSAQLTRTTNGDVFQTRTNTVRPSAEPERGKAEHCAAKHNALRSRGQNDAPGTRRSVALHGGNPLSQVSECVGGADRTRGRVMDFFAIEAQPRRSELHEWPVSICVTVCGFRL